MTDMVSAVLRAAQRSPGLPALTVGSTSVTYGELARRVRASASALLRAGLAPGERVLFSIRPGIDAVVLALGIVAARGCVVFADPGAGEALFRSRMRLAQPRWVAAESLLYAASTPLLKPFARRRGLDLPDYRSIVADAQFLHSGRWLPGTPRGSTSVSALASGSGDDIADSDRHLGDEALVVFTSGTTDIPRAVVHARGSLGAGLTDFAEGTGLRGGMRVVTDQLMVGIPALIAGAHWTLPGPGLHPGAQPEAYVDLLQRADLFFAVPTVMDALLTYWDDAPQRAPDLSTIVLGGAPVLIPLLARIHARFPNAAIRAVYGMTEVLPVAIADGIAKLDAGQADDGGDAVGVMASSVTARIDQGELVLSGPGLAKGYLADLPQSPLIELRTGDRARIDGDQLILLGRKKDMFIRGTQNVYPSLYEPSIAGLEGVSGAALTGVSNEFGDDQIILLVVPDEGAPATPSSEHPLIARVRRSLPGLIDAGVLPDHIVAVRELPVAGRSRKLDRAKATQMARDWLLSVATPPE